MYLTVEASQIQVKPAVNGRRASLIYSKLVSFTLPYRTPFQPLCSVHYHKNLECWSGKIQNLRIWFLHVPHFLLIHVRTFLSANFATTNSIQFLFRYWSQISRTNNPMASMYSDSPNGITNGTEKMKLHRQINIPDSSDASNGPNVYFLSPTKSDFPESNENLLFQLDPSTFMKVSASKIASNI